MRTELQRLEGELCHVTGRLLEKRAVPGMPDFHNLLISRPRFFRWDGCSALNPYEATPDAAEDHLWVRLPKDSVEVTLLGECQLMGTVHWYTRNDGTIDLGIKTLPCMDVDRVMNQVIDALENPLNTDWLSKARSTLHTIKVLLSGIVHQGEGGYAWSRHLSAMEAGEQLLDLYKRLELNIVATEGRLATTKANGRCNRLREVGRIAGHKSTTVARGFA